MMWRFKSCPKCSGDLFIDWDMDGWYVQCLQCGYHSDQDNALPDMKEVVQKERKLAKTSSGKPRAK
jgi:DNA-directed RNA polymerase subunit M/transcription elongation factor TFIIS